MDLIKNIVLEYVNSNSKNHYALMITGEWGSGKTYYFKEVISKEIANKTNKSIVYISLNGVSSHEELYQNIIGEKLREIEIFKKYKTGKLLFGALKSLTSIAVGIGDTYSNNALSSIIDKFLKKNKDTLLSFSDSIICFDDLERISNKYDFADALGFINSNFVEHEGMKIIIICNEGEIISKGSSEKTESIKEEEEKYNRIKEKLIGRTLTFLPNIRDIIANIIESHKASNQTFYSFLSIRKDYIIQKIEMSDEKNIRSVLFMFDNLKTVFESVEENKMNNFSHQLILSVIILSLEEKKGELAKYNDIDDLPVAFKYNSNDVYALFPDLELDSPSSNSENELKNSNLIAKNKFSRDYLKDKYWGSDDYFFFASIFEFIKRGVIDKEKLNKEIKELIPTEQTPQIQVLNKIKQSLALNDDDFKQSFSQLIQYIKNGNYKLPEFIEAAQALHFLSSVGIIPGYPKEVLNQFLIEHIDQTRPNSSTDDLLSIKRAMGSRTPQFHDSKDLLDKIESIIELLKNEEKEKIIDNNLQKIKNSDYADITKDEFREIIRYHSFESIRDVVLFKFENAREKLAVINDLFSHTYDDASQPHQVLPKEAENLNKLLEWVKSINDSITQNEPISKYWIRGLHQILENITNNMQITDNPISHIDF